MANKTKFLKLNIPTAGDTQWGTSMNRNMETIDSGLLQLAAKINNLSQYFTSNNAMVFTENGEHYVKLDSNKGDFITVGVRDEDGKFEATTIYYHPEYVGSKESDLTYNDIVNSTAFYVWESFTDGGKDNSPYDVEYTIPRGAILVKGEDLSEGTLTYSFTIFAQGIGTVYVPKVMSKDNTKLKFEREFLADTEDNLIYDITLGTFDAAYKGTTITLDKDKTTAEVELTDLAYNGTDIPNANIRFFTNDKNTKVAKEVYLDYKFKNDGIKYTLQLDYNISESVEIYIRYAIYTKLPDNE